MCVSSAIGDYWRDGLAQKPYWPVVQPHIEPHPWATLPPPEVSRAEFLQLKADIEELKKLLLAAKQYDAAAGEPDCELESKIALIKKVADLVGVSMKDVFGASK